MDRLRRSDLAKKDISANQELYDLQILLTVQFHLVGRNQDPVPPDSTARRALSCRHLA
eukprot:CAMPEP_0113675304 /NCGR_PEP_ID=MMETSP0038_2-20120614/7937_1 /TAXON_ID=2898 /ORGANISM="Cryptomonas paramecium" /LENGTH=57 /DNA_ID=CAMNT_0000592055 /DNA_START=551 /DNA_END=720 /DNA_ORIENTATION=- /assembly_acc=CAM_ASM_000170